MPIADKTIVSFRFDEVVVPAHKGVINSDSLAKPLHMLPVGGKAAWSMQFDELPKLIVRMTLADGTVGLGEFYRDLGATYHAGPVTDVEPVPDIIVEATGASAVVLDAMCHTGANGIVCLTGISSGGHPIQLDAATLNRTIVLENDLVFGSVNANMRHYEAAARALAAADRDWLERLITRRVPLERWREALTREEHDIKVVVELGQVAGARP